MDKFSFIKNAEPADENLLFIIAIVFLLQSCKDDVQPKPEKQYSYWKINGQSFNSNKVERAVGNARSGIQCEDPNNWFSLGFYLPYLPTTGIWPIGDSILSHQQNPNYGYIGFYFNNVFYAISPNDEGFFVANTVNNKASYYLAPVWFVNPQNPTDSVLIEGTFNEF